MSHNHFESFLALCRLMKSMAGTPFTGKRFSIDWTLWIDPGTHTGLAAALYATPLPGSGETSIQLAERMDAALKGVHIAASPRGEGLVGSEVPGAPGATGAALVAVWTELLYDDERQMTRDALARVRRIGAQFTGSNSWDTMTGEIPGDEHAHLGLAGVGAERFVVLKPQRDAEYLSPERVRSMFAYGLEEEFGIDMAGQMPGDAKSTFSDERLRRAGLYQPGSDHPRDALRHALLAIRKTVLA